MKYSLIALAASTSLGGAYANQHNRRHVHARQAAGNGTYGTGVPPPMATGTAPAGQSWHVEQASSCACSTYVTSYLVDVTVPASAPTAPATTVVPMASAPASSGVPPMAPSGTAPSGVVPPSGVAATGSAPAPSMPAASAPAPSMPAASAPAPSAPAASAPAPSAPASMPAPSAPAASGYAPPASGPAPSGTGAMGSAPAPSMPAASSSVPFVPQEATTSVPIYSETSPMPALSTASEECSEVVITSVVPIATMTQTATAWVSSAPVAPVSSGIVPPSGVAGTGSAPAPSAPAASMPAASMPVASAPVASAPAASMPVASAPVESAPVASVPATKGSSTILATASTPATSAPATSAPATSAPAKPVPTPDVTTVTSPGVYTIPATTVTLSSTETTIVPAVTTIPAGPQTYGGVTTIVQTETTITCPYATVSTSGSVTTSILTHTTYYCPASGTYTIGATTTTAPTGGATVTYPQVTEYPPGTYSHDDITTTIVETSTVITCPFSNAAGSTTAAASAPASTTPGTVLATATTPVASSSVPAPTATGSAGNGTQPWAITYSPYTDSGDCKSQSAIQADVKDIASRGFQNVRLYSTDCHGLDYVGEVCSQYGLGIIMGIYIETSDTSTADEQVDALITWASGSSSNWSLITVLVVGNEVVFNGILTAEALTSYITSVSSKVKAAGFTGSITTSETTGTYQSNTALCSALDIVGVNIQPFFDGGCTASGAGDFLLSQIKIAETACPGAAIWVLEAGWPSAGNANNDAVPGTEEQKQAIDAMEAANAGHVCYFAYENEKWKQTGEYGVETFFGCHQQFSISVSLDVDVAGIVKASASAGINL